jgi:hypothetical protein
LPVAPPFDAALILAAYNSFSSSSKSNYFSILALSADSFFSSSCIYLWAFFYMFLSPSSCQYSSSAYFYAAYLADCFFSSFFAYASSFFSFTPNFFGGIIINY